MRQYSEYLAGEISKELGKSLINWAMPNSQSVIILGSSRSQGDTRKVIDFIRQEMPIDLIDLNHKNISYYDYDHKNQGDDYLNLMEELIGYSTFIMATPVYWYSMSAPMKTFFDRLSDLVTIRKDLGKGLAGKKMASISCGSDNDLKDGFYMPFRETAYYLKMDYLGHLHTWVENQKIPNTVTTMIKEFISRQPF